MLEPGDQKGAGPAITFSSLRETQRQGSVDSGTQCRVGQGDGQEATS